MGHKSKRIEMVGWINRVLTNEESPEAKLLRQKISYIGILLIFAAAVGLMPVYQDWTMEVLPAVVVAVIGFVLIVIDMVQTWIGLRVANVTPPSVPPSMGGSGIVATGREAGSILNEPVSEGVFHTDVREEKG